MDMVTFASGILLGAIIATAVIGVGLKWMVKGKQINTGGVMRVGVFVALFMAFAVAQHVAFGQTTEPLNIPTGVIFSETNNWLETFAPIAAIGIGISIALAVLGYLGKMIKSAFT